MADAQKVEQIRDLLRSNGNKFFSVDYIKKDGTPRKLTGLTGVRKDLKGGDRSWNPEETGRMFVWDRNADPSKARYRTVDLKTVTAIRINGKEYTWDM